jgi:hypothetical protein
MAERGGLGLLQGRDAGIPLLRNSHGGSFMSGIFEAMQNALMLPREVYEGKVDPMSDEGIGRAFDMAGSVTLGAGAVPAEANSLRAGIKAYHGSPHDFDRFSLDKIGTGEGAQAYGHGLYFAENEGVARNYRDNLSAGAKPGDYGWLVDGVPHTELPPAQRQAVEDYIRTRDVAYLDDAGLGKAIINAAPAGKMYEVEINADPEHFLDWDKPLSEQHPTARDAVNRVARDPAPYGLDRVTDDMRGVEMAKLLQSPEATAKLREAGVPGIKYLDGGSRTTGDGTRNYVTFSDEIVNIVKKYGIAGLAMLPPAVLMQNGIDPRSVQGGS